MSDGLRRPRRQYAVKTNYLFSPRLFSVHKHDRPDRILVRLWRARDSRRTISPEPTVGPRANFPMLNESFANPREIIFPFFVLFLFRPDKHVIPFLERCTRVSGRKHSDTFGCTGIIYLGIAFKPVRAVCAYRFLFFNKFRGIIEFSVSALVSVSMETKHFTWKSC